MQTVLKWKSRDYERMEIWATTSAAAADWRSTLFENCVKMSYRTHGISNTVTNMMSGIFAGVSNRAVLQIGWCFK